MIALTGLILSNPLSFKFLCTTLPLRVRPSNGMLFFGAGEAGGIHALLFRMGNHHWCGGPQAIHSWLCKLVVALGEMRKKNTGMKI